MTATLYEKNKGSREWWVRLTVRRADCISDASRDRRASVKVGPRTIAAALAEESNGLLASARLQGIEVRACDLLRQAAVQLRGRHQGATATAAALTVAEYAPSWLETVEGSTAYLYRGIFDKHIAPVFGGLPLNRIGKRLVREWLQDMEKTAAHTTVQTRFGVFAALLSQAVRDEEISHHPCPTMRTVRSRRKRYVKQPPRALTTAEFAKVIRALRVVEPSFNRRGAVEFQAATGCRIGEAIALKWGDIDLGAHTASISRRVYRGELGPAKGRNVREVQLGQGLVRDLRRLRKEQRELALGRGTRPGPWVFQNHSGSYWRYNMMRQVWKAAVTEARLLPPGESLKGVKLGTHVLRHSYATHRLQEGVPPADVAKVLGDALPTLYRVYAHAMPEENRDRLKVDLDAII